MRRVVVAVALAAPVLVVSLFWLQPEVDLMVHVPLFHFYIVSFTSFAATVVSFLLIVALGSVARPRHLLAAVAFAVMGSLFMSHGLTTPGAIIESSHPAVPAVGWSAWLTLFSGAVVFAVAGADRARRLSQRFLLRFILIAAIAVITYISVVVVMPSWLRILEANASGLHRQFLLLVTLAMWLFAAFQMYRTWRQTRGRVDGALVLVTIWLAEATVSMHLFAEWSFAWWLYHFLLLCSFLFTAFVLFTTYEQARRFRLIGYYVAASLILTALLALTASYLFSRLAQDILSEEIAHMSTDVLETFVASVTAELPEDMPTDRIREVYIERLNGFPVDTAVLYDVQGKRIYPKYSRSNGRYAENRGAYWDPVLAGETVVFVQMPESGYEEDHDYGSSSSHDYEHDHEHKEDGSASHDYEEGNSEAHEYDEHDSESYGYGGYGGASAHTLTSYIAIGPDSEPAGVLMIIEELPGLTQTILQARRVGLLIATFTMGLLFAFLFVVVRRADRIITTRTDELAVAYRNLRQAEEMRDDMSHMIIHDLRTPLTTISMSLEALKRLPEGGSRADIQDRIVERTNRAVQRLDRMIEDILTVGKIETGELQPKFEPVLLDSLLADWIDPFFVQAVAEDKTLKLDCEPELKAAIDPTLTGRVLENLISNALKYTAAGGQIDVLAHANNGSILVSVRDDGEGIPDDYKEYIFHKFSQVPSTAERPTRKGAGLGLAFCRLVVEAHGGRIWVEDAVDGGSEFKLQLPVKPAWDKI